jgi:flavorubredoxin
MSMQEFDKAIEVAPNTYWVGFYDPQANFHCNPYLIVEDGEGILIDPGSVPHFPTVARKVASVLPFNKIRHIVLHHQDPDLAANVPVFEKVINNPELRIVTTERASFLVSYYGFKAPYRLVEEGELKVGRRVLQFHRTPYLHAPGAFTTYDPLNKVLFSSDIFGAFSEDWQLYAEEGYTEKMYGFHHTYMPPGQVLANQMEQFSKLDIDLIAPQHGSIINRPLVRHNIEALAAMKTGAYVDWINAGQLP